MKKANTPYIFDFHKIGNPAIGYISVAESSKLPFSVQRVYWTYFTPHDVIRGNHAHWQLEQVLVAVSGQISVHTIDSAGHESDFELTKPNVGLYIPSLCWRTLQFSHSAVLMCLASSEFAEEDYIRDINQFRAIISK